MLLSAALSRFFPYPVRQRGEQLHGFNAVRIISGGPFDVEAVVQGTARYEVHLERDGNDLLVTCECPYFDSDGACKHIWGVLLEAGDRGYLLGNRGTAPSRLIEDWIDDEDTDLQLSSRAVARPRAAAWQGLLQEIQFHESRKAPADAWKAEREIYYVIDVAQSIATSSLYVEAAHRDLKKDGEWGKLKTANFSRLVLPQLPAGRDREILTVLGGVHDPYAYSYHRDTIPFVFRLSGPLIELVMPKVCATGRCRLRLNSTDALEQQTPLSWDDGPPWQFRLAVERGSKGWQVRGIFTRAGETMDLRLPTLLIAEGFLFVNGRMARFEDEAAFGWIRLLRRESKIDVPFDHAGEFLGQLLEQPAVPPADWPEELRYKEVAVKPRPQLKIEKSDSSRLWGKPILFGRLSFDYAGAVIEADSPVRGVYDGQQRQLMPRDLQAEREARDLLLRLGLKAGTPYELSPAKLPAIVRELSAAGWAVEADGKAFRTSSGIRAEVTSGIDWFELQATVDYGGSELKLPDLLKAIRRGESMVTLDDGSLGVIPEDLLDRYGMLIAMGRAQGDHVRFSRAQTGVLDALLAAREEIRFDAGFERARAELRRFDRIEAASQPGGFVGELRVYQREGLAWMQFLEGIGFGGCLADDMGVGKTPQVLALLETRRELRAGGQALGPALVVVPRSLIFNWMQESARFTPRIRVLDHSGSGRSKDIGNLAAFDLILTTYGTLRRDAVEFQNLNFDYVILDEAQAIKNANSESAKAARLLRADHRLAMSGTPIENHLGELWSLFEFLNPGMLGSIPGTSAAGKAMRNPDGATRELLAKAVRPFILRRTKDLVAKELPPKLEQTIYCELRGTQRKQYDELRDHYRRAVLGRIDKQGMSKSKMHILEALLRLRQAACHPGLLDDSRRGESSAKFEVLLPQLAEVIEEGHKALVFSQFTSLLSIVRDELDSSNTPYEYLDGRTRDRQARVERFQSDPDCRLFLISLKAGGVGLNLTAAEYVFLLDPWWNPAVEAQAIDRTHRIGQRNRVFAYRLIARDTVEEKVLELQGHKRNLADAIIRADTNLVRDLKREDLEFLLS